MQWKKYDGIQIPSDFFQLTGETIFILFCGICNALVGEEHLFTFYLFYYSQNV